MFQLLFAHGADPNFKARHGHTPHNMAINARRSSAVIAVLEGVMMFVFQIMLLT
jgi:hypothetical protein